MFNCALEVYGYTSGQRKMYAESNKSSGYEKSKNETSVGVIR